MRKVFLIMLLLLPAISAICASEEEAVEVADSSSESKFNTVDFLFEHVNDSYEWHFFTTRKFHCAIPLPVILHSSEKGWVCFLSSKLRGNDPNFPFMIQKGGRYDGKVVEKLNNGEIVRPFDISMTKTVTGVILLCTALSILIIYASRKTSKDPYKTPKGLQNLIEPVVLFVRDDIAKPFVGEKYAKYLPYLLTLFCFVLVANLLGLVLPLGLNITGNIAITFVLALFTYIITTFTANKHYWAGVFNPEVPIFMKCPIPIMQFVEFVGTLIKPVVLMIRLFANMFSGHIIVAALVALIYIIAQLVNVWAAAGTSLVSIFFSAFMVLIDLLVSFIQAYIFTLLSALYFGMANEKEEAKKA